MYYIVNKVRTTDPVHIFTCLMFPEVVFTKQSDFFLRLCVSYICSYISPFRRVHILGQCLGDEKLLTSNALRRGTLKATDSQL